MIATIKDKKVKIGECDFFCGDKNADTVTFKAPLTFGGVSLENIPVYIKTRNALGGHGKAALTSKKEGDDLLVSWTLGAEATAVCGRLACQLVFEKADGSTVLNTDIFHVYIGASIPDDAPGVVIETNHITQLQNQLAELIKNCKALADGDYVVSVNGETGVAVLTPEKIGAIASGANISLLVNDKEYVTLSEEQAAISAHDSSETAHEDLRDKITELQSEISSSDEYAKSLAGKSGSVTVQVASWTGNVCTFTLADMGNNDAVFFTPSDAASKTALENADVLVTCAGNVVTFTARRAPDTVVNLEYFISRGKSDDE